MKTNYKILPYQFGGKERKKPPQEQHEKQYYNQSPVRKLEELSN